MSTTPLQNAAKSEKLESLAVLEGGYDRNTPGYTHDARFGHGLPNSTNDESPVALHLSIRRGCLVLITVVAVAGISALAVVFNRGLEVSRFDAKTKNATEQAEMLDDYNSYTGNVVSAFGKPVDIFVTLVVQVIVLRFMVAAMLKPQLTWKVGAVTIALSASVGYLISNGFNALNVQLRSLEIPARISDVDLAYERNASALSSPTAIDWTRTTTENAPQNPLTNTILREVVTARMPKAPPLCDWLFGQDTGFGDVPGTTLEIGFTQRDWQTRLLQNALEPTIFQVVLNTTDPTTTNPPNVAKLPMNASLAADLFIYGTTVGRWLFPWGGAGGFADNADMNKRYQNVNESTAIIAGLLPPRSPATTETAKRRWFLRQIPAAVSWQFTESPGPTQTSLANIGLQFSHFEISSSLHFDAITFEFDVDPARLSNATSRDPATRYNTLDLKKSCGPWPALCVVDKMSYTSSNNYLYYDTPAQVGTFAVCVNDDSTEELVSEWPKKFGLATIQCTQSSNSSLLVVSIGKRLVADGLWQNKSADATGLLNGTGSAVIKNLRKVYSYTIGRLSWSLDDLSSTFNATCESTSLTNCQGLQLPLTAAKKDPNQDPTTQQHLVAGADALPLGLAPKLAEKFFTYRPRLMPLVKLNEPPRKYANPDSIYDNGVGDVLMAHNIQSVQWNMDQLLIANKVFGQGNTCDPYVEDRIYLALKNHRYMEQSLQPAYTAATFFLFQNGVVKDAVQLGANRASLNFAENQQPVALWVSIPDRNAWLTLGGCVVLVISLSHVLMLSTCRTNSTRGAALGDTKEPQVIARVMLDEGQFPPTVLHRRVVYNAGNEKDLRQLDEFLINGLSLQSQQEQARLYGTEP